MCSCVCVCVCVCMFGHLTCEKMPPGVKLSQRPEERRQAGAEGGEQGALLVVWGYCLILCDNVIFCLIMSYTV